MAKGISAVIATIMLLMITVALIAVFYVFSSSLVSSSTGAVGGVATSTTDRMLKTIALSTATCTSVGIPPATNSITFTIQNVGTKDILAGELKTYVDDAANTATDTTVLAANAQTSITATTTTYSKTRALRVQGPSNQEIKSLTC